MEKIMEESKSDLANALALVEVGNRIIEAYEKLEAPITTLRVYLGQDLAWELIEYYKKNYPMSNKLTHSQVFEWLRSRYNLPS